GGSEGGAFSIGLDGACAPRGSSRRSPPHRWPIPSVPILGQGPVVCNSLSPLVFVDCERFVMQVARVVSVSRIRSDAKFLSLRTLVRFVSSRRTCVQCVQRVTCFEPASLKVTIARSASTPRRMNPAHECIESFG